MFSKRKGKVDGIILKWSILSLCIFVCLFGLIAYYDTHMNQCKKEMILISWKGNDLHLNISDSGTKAIILQIQYVA